jgi:hypothetical protein
MEIAELFAQMEREYRNTPWDWPRSMEEDQLEFWQQAFPQCELECGAYIGEKIVLRAKDSANVITVSNLEFV